VSRWTFTSESVTEGHPDKMADQISDSVLDAILAEDPNGRVACETLLTDGACASSPARSRRRPTSTSPSWPGRRSARSATTTRCYGFDGSTCGVIVSIDEQSPNIAQGVDTSEELRGGTAGEDQINAQGAGGPGDDVRLRLRRDPDLMPLPIWTAHRLAERPGRGAQVGPGAVPAPDGKTQVTYEYEDGRRSP
jgi:S-adenosylmethionine synthetase